MPSAKHGLRLKAKKYIIPDKIASKRPFFIKFLVKKYPLLLIVLSLLALSSCGSSGPENDVIGFWKGKKANAVTVVEFGKDYVVYYYGPSKVLDARKKGPTQIKYAVVGDELQALETGLNTPLVKVTKIKGDNAHIQISTFYDDFVRIIPEEGKSLMVMDN